MKTHEKAELFGRRLLKTTGLKAKLCPGAKGYTFAFDHVPSVTFYTQDELQALIRIGSDNTGSKISVAYIVSMLDNSYFDPNYRSEIIAREGKILQDFGWKMDKHRVQQNFGKTLSEIIFGITDQEIGKLEQLGKQLGCIHKSLRRYILHDYRD